MVLIWSTPAIPAAAGSAGSSRHARARDAPLGYPYVWYWRQKPRWTTSRDGKPVAPRVFDRERKGERCRVLARGTMNSGLLEFEDGYRVVTSRNGLRRADA